MLAESRNENRIGGYNIKQRKHNFNEWLKKHPEIRKDNCRPSITIFDNENVTALTYRNDEGKKTYWQVYYITSLGENMMLTTGQACSVATLRTSYDYSLAKRGNTEFWNNVPCPNPIDDPLENWETFKNQLIPNTTCDCEDPYFKKLAEESNVFKTSISSFLNKEKTRKIFFCDYKKTYESIDGTDNMSNEELNEINDVVYKESLEYFHHNTRTVGARLAISSRAARNFQKETNYKYAGGFFNILDDIWFDPNTIEILPYFIPEFWTCLQSMKSNALITPNSQAAKEVLNSAIVEPARSAEKRDNHINPLNYSLTLGNAALNTLKAFDTNLGLNVSLKKDEKKSQEEQMKELDKQIQTQLKESVKQLNKYRGVEYNGGNAFGDVADSFVETYNESEEEIVEKVSFDLFTYRCTLVQNMANDSSLYLSYIFN